MFALVLCVESVNDVTHTGSKQCDWAGIAARKHALFVYTDPTYDYICFDGPMLVLQFLKHHQQQHRARTQQTRTQQHQQQQQQQQHNKPREAGRGKEMERRRMRGRRRMMRRRRRMMRMRRRRMIRKRRRRRWRRRRSLPFLAVVVSQRRCLDHCRVLLPCAVACPNAETRYYLSTCSSCLPAH